MEIKSKYLHFDKKKTSELLIGLWFSMGDRLGATKEVQESYSTMGSRLHTITKECLDMQKQTCVLFHNFSLLETV